MVDQRPRLCSSRYSSQRVSNLLGRPKSYTTSDVRGGCHSFPKYSTNFPKSRGSPIPYCGRMGSEGYSHQRSAKNPHSCTFQQTIWCRQGPDRLTSSHRLVTSKSLLKMSRSENGDPRETSGLSPRPYVGCNYRRSRCISKRENCRKIPEVFLFHPEEQSLHVFKDALRVISSPLDIFKVNENNKKVSKNQDGQHQLVHRRFHCMGKILSINSNSYELDKTAPNLVRSDSQCEEVVSSPAATSPVFGSNPRSPPPDSPTPSGQDREAPITDEISVEPHSNLQEDFGESGRSHNVFTLNNPFGPYACQSNHYVVEQAHFCQCQRCSCRYRRISAPALISFFEQEMASIQSELQETHPRLGTDVGCVRLWLEWCYNAILHKGFLVATGATRIHQLEGNGSNSVFSEFPQDQASWTIINDPHRQSGDIFLFKKDGFGPVSLNEHNCKGFSFSVLDRKNHFSGPIHKGQQQCSCGRRIKGQSRCCPQLFGPSNFRVLFQKVRICTLDGLVRIHGEYEVQVLRLSMSGRQSKLPGSRCPVSGLEHVRQSLHVSSSHASSEINFKNYELPGKGCSYSTLYEQFFPGGSRSQSFKKDKVTRHLFSFSNEEWFHGDPSEVLGLVDVGIRPNSLGTNLPTSDSNLVTDQVSEDLECVNSAFSPEQSRRPPQAPLPDIPSVVRAHRSALIYNRYISRGLTKQAAKTCLNKHSVKTKNQYGGKWRRFIQFLEKKQIPDAEVKEETVVNFLSYRQLEQRVKPLTLVNDYYGIVEPLLAAFNVNINLSARDSLVKHFLDGSLRDSKRKPMFDKFPNWKLQVLLDYLNSNMFEPLEEADFDCLLRKTLMLTLLNTGRRACEISALTPVFSESNGEIQLNWYNNFVAKSERPFDTWLSTPPKLSKIDPCGSDGEKQERFENLCPIRAFKLYIAKRKSKETPEFKNYLWLASPPDLSSIIKCVLRDMLRWRYPGIPPAELPSVGTHQIRKSVISTEWMYRPNVLQLPRWVGNRGMSVLNTIYIRDTQAPSCHAALPGGTLYENMVQIRFPITPRRS